MGQFTIAENAKWRAHSLADEGGFFSPSNVKEPLSNIRGQQVEIANIQNHLLAFIDPKRGPGTLGVASHSASLAGQAMNRYRGTQAEFQFSIVAPHTAHSKLLISRASAMCSLRS
jgi:hypothetical protein